MTPSEPDADDDGLRVSLVRGDALFRLQRAVGLIPPAGLGLARRAFVLAAVTWAPIAVWAAVSGRVFGGSVAEPLLQHFGVHVRCLVAIPLLVFAEGLAHAVTMSRVPHFIRSGLVGPADRARFVEIVRGVVALRDSSLPWVAIVGVVVAWVTFSPVAHDMHDVLWAADDPASTRLGFGGWWFLYVARPVYIALMFGWLWRVLLLFVLFSRIARLDLALVPTHPDRAGGLGFLEDVPTVFALVTLAASTVLASRWAHDVIYHGARVDSFRVPAILFVATLLVLFLSPLTVFARSLPAAKRRALLDYGALVGEHGRLVGRRWIAGETLPDPALLSAPEIGPVADTLSLYDAVARMRAVPIGKQSIAAIAVPAALPLLAVFAIEVPVKDLLLKLLMTVA